MRVLVVGTGIIGTIYGWALNESGHHVAHLVRAGRAAALRNGLEVDLFDRRRSRRRNFRGLYKLTVVEALASADTFDLIVVPTKHYALAPTLAEIAPQADTADFLLLTQNWRGTNDIDPILPRARYVYGDAKAGGTFAQGALVGALKAIDIGPPEGGPSALARKCESLFASSGIQTQLHSDMLHYLWIQYAITGALWAALIQAGSLEAILNAPDAAPAALRAVRECLEVVRQRGVDLSLYPETGPFLSNSTLRRRINIWMTRWLFRHDEYTKRCSGHAFGDPVEVRTFYDDLITTGRQLGVPMPVTASYAEAVERFAVTT